MYRVRIPSAEMGSNYVRARGAERLRLDRRGHADGTHPGRTRCFDSGRGVFDYDTFVRQKGQLSFSASLVVQKLERMLVTVGGGLVSAARFGAYDHGKLFSDAGQLQDMIDLAALGHAGNSQIVVSGAILDEGDDARRNWKIVLDKFTMQRMFMFDQFAHRRVVNALVSAGIRRAHERHVIHPERLEIILVCKFNSLVC